MISKKISIVSPVYNEEGNIIKFYNSLKSVLDLLNYSYEIIFINDGSKDNSLLLLAKLAQDDKSVKVINFSKNFGHQMAITAGIDYAKCDALIILDSDLQDPPIVIKELIKKWEEGYQIVNAKRKSRNDGFLKDFTAIIFYKLLNSLLTNKIPENVGDFRLIDKKPLEILKSIKEKDRYLRGLTTWIGYKQTEVLYDRAKREWGRTGYTIGKMIALAMNAIFSFSKLPMKLATFFSIIFFTISLGVIIYVLLSIAGGSTAPGWASQLIILSIFLGIQMFILAIISEYVGRIYFQVQNRPLYIIEDKINFEENDLINNS